MNTVFLGRPWKLVGEGYWTKNIKTGAQGKTHIALLNQSTKNRDNSSQEAQGCFGGPAEIYCSGGRIC